MDFTSVYTIIKSALTFFFPAEFLETPTVSLFVDLFLLVAGMYMLYFILIKPFIVLYRSVISWRCRK